jgi:hypothetical protein
VRPRTAVLTFSLLLAVMIGMYGLLFLPESIYSELIDEERPVESIGALGLLASSVFFFLACRRTPGDDRAGRVMRLALGALAILFLIGFGEEISWGQRLLGIGTPDEIKTASHQGELNFHNLNALDGWLDPDRLFQLFWFLFGVLLPVGVALYTPARRLLRRYVPIMPLVTAAALVANQALHDVAKTFFEGRYTNSSFPLAHSLFETKESVVALAFAVGAFELYRRARTEADEARLPGIDERSWPDVSIRRAPEPEGERKPDLSSA